jgi:2-C-methyl-D-erythritol 2,4-cyclodiphosphate synthase
MPNAPADAGGLSGMPRIGSGIDVHAFASEPEGSLGTSPVEVVLAGVRIPSHAALEGHSDADVVAHAVIDALLGAAGLGDIGERFGVDDPDVAGADSMAMLAAVHREVVAAGWRAANVDLTVVAARPRIAEHRPAMRAALAEVLELPVAAVSVKATTTDGLGSIGRGEGVAAWAVCLLAPVDADGAPAPRPSGRAE